jgi:hypothetical protein
MGFCRSGFYNGARYISVTGKLKQAMLNANIRHQSLLPPAATLYASKSLDDH